MFRVRDAEGNNVAEGKAALQEREVGPGEKLATTLVIPPEFEPGLYRVTIDMVEENQGWFYQLAAEPMEEELEIRE
jgi:hypothetical protein